MAEEITQCAPDQSLTCRLIWQMTENEVAARLLGSLVGSLLAVTAILLIAWLARWLAHRAIDRTVSRAASGMLPSGLGRLSKGDRTDGASEASAVATSRRAQRSRTTGSLLKSIVTALIGAIAIIMALSEIGLNVAPLIASAGVVGLALGFGAQNLVKDFLSGIFLIFEDQIGVGDVVDVGAASGTVEAVGLRVTRLRDTDGTVWYCRNGEILRVGNQSQNWARAVIDVALPYETDLAAFTQVLRDAGHDLWEDDDFRGVLVEEPEVWGVQELTHDLLTIRITVKTAPLEQWRVARTLRERIKLRLDAAGLTGTPLS